MPWKKTPAVPIKPDELRPPDVRRQDGVLSWALDESPTQLLWMPSAGWRLLVVTARAPIYASLPEGELFKLIKAYGLRSTTHAVTLSSEHGSTGWRARVQRGGRDD